METSSVSYNIDLDPFLVALGGDAFGYFAASEVHRLFYDAMPYRDGGFANTIDFGTPWQYEHLVPYAEYVYFSNCTFRRDTNKAATREYIDNYPSALPKLQASLAAYVKEKITG